MDRLKGKTALIVGASSGIGRATALLFANEGANVVVTARRRDKLEQLVDAIESNGGRAAALVGDVHDEEFAAASVALAESRFGGLDIAFNNAGINGEMGPSAAISLEGWRNALDVNLTGAFLGAKHQIPALQRRGGGSLIFTSTFVGYTAGMPGAAAYAASKAGIIGLMKTLAAELGPSGIRVNAILPGGTATRLADAWTDTPEKRAFVEGMHALKRIATPDEIAQSVLYLASDEASFTTGSAMLVDGGVSINRT
ncbi:SDR family oxidoreductase [Phyllobacterium sp. UNC302MFCol5.2]|uniref:SDR family oxidoreductase n=1 Tax=Phyllobacterium sp. UNC302MFCol5.2 TaxID=1449065 RepID=UPI00047F4928|nr:SDR family oxidoreductase [Phyllobacterium sp. UNC302MFCol5.2]